MATSDAKGSAATALAFPDGFLWGAATSAYQIEGAATADGRAPSVWDTFSHLPGKVRGGDTGDIACDFYHRFGEDIDLIAGLGLGAFRFSVSWSRVQPSGRGAINQAGLDFYRSLVDALRARSIEPAITLYHWDHPQALEDAGGWANRDTAERFADYAQILAEAIGDTGGTWITLNEPQVVANQGYRNGVHAPGLRDDALAAATTHHLMLAHGLALQRLRSVLPGARVGITLDIHPIRAAGPDARDAAAVTDAEQNRIWIDPVIHGRYPARAREHLLPPPSLIRDGDMELIGAPTDFLGVNYYSPHYVRLGDSTALQRGETAIPARPGVILYKPAQLPVTSMGWLIEPSGLYDTLVTLAAETTPGLPLYITENGCAAEDYVNPDGVVDDIERVEYVHGHLAAAWRAIRDGVPLAGYFYWSLHDNFEWSWGYQKRFGLLFVDYDTQRRRPKRSAAFYSRVARTNELPPLDVALRESAAAQSRKPG
ncbi:MAG: GH1 family beta-glucosidase [Solirubrobacteraceae bacterium]|jgi:beta-glucosidase